MRLSLLVLLLVALSAAEQRYCPYTVEIDEAAVQDGDCYESSSPQGVSAMVSGEYFEDVVIWDSDFPCPVKNHLFILFAGDYDGVLGAKMGSAEAGNTDNYIHTYRAAIFEILPVPQGVAGCFPVDWKKHHYCQTTWRVAQYGTECNNPEL